MEYVLPNFVSHSETTVINPTCIRLDFGKPIWKIRHPSFGKEFFAVDVPGQRLRSLPEATAVATAPRRTLTDEGPWN